MVLRFAPVVLFFTYSLAATEISTGFLLGPKYDSRAFYTRRGPNETWQKTYSGSEYRRQAQGKLMNLRLAQAIYHDEWMKDTEFDSDANTGAVIRALEFFRSHGVLMINVSLQGGAPGENGQIYGKGRKNGFRYGPAEGIHVSAFKPDGSLKPEWMARLEKLIHAADEKGMIVNLMYFYQGQDELFDNYDAIHAAARNATDWLIDRKCRNVIIDVANEWDLPGDRWDFASYIPSKIVQLIREIRGRFEEKNADFALPIGASSDGRMEYPESLTTIVDVVFLHGNGRTPEQKVARLKELQDVPRPVLFNEDDNGRETTVGHLKRELASATAGFDFGAGWGYMPWVQAQRFPFRYLPGPDSEVTDGAPAADRDMAYFHAVLDHIADMTLRKDVHLKQTR
jgi:hypothetical protein